MALVKIITGEYNSGKTTKVKQLLEAALARGEKAAGIISETDDDGKKERYFVKDITTGRRVAAVSMQAPHSEGGWVKYDFSRFYFSEKAFSFADDVLTARKVSDSDVIFIDEMGPLELSGRGSFKAVKSLLSGFDGVLYLVIRKKILNALCEKLELNAESVDFIEVDYQAQ